MFSFLFMFRFVYKGSHFVKALSMTSLQVVGHVAGATLPPLSPNLKPPCRTEWNKNIQKMDQAPLSISAGEWLDYLRS